MTIADDSRTRLTDETPEGWHGFTSALPPALYARLVARAESEGVDVLTEAAYLLAYGLDNCPKPSEAHLEPLSEPERAEALKVRMRLAARAVGELQRSKPGA